MTAEPRGEDPDSGEARDEGPGPLRRGLGALAGVGDRVGDGLRAIRHRDQGRSPVVVDDDPDAEVVDGDVGAEPDLLSLDETGAGDAADVLRHTDLDRPGGAALWGLLDRIDGGPELLPVASDHGVGLGPLLRGLLEAEDPPALQEWAVDRVLGLVGDRYTLTVGPDGVTVRGLLRRRFTPWSEIGAVVVVNRFDALKGGALARLIDSAIRYPIPGLGWLLERIFGALTDRLARLVLGADEVEAWRRSSGHVVVGIERKGFDIDLDGLLLLVSLLARGTTAAIVAEADRRGIEVDGAD